MPESDDGLLSEPFDNMINTVRNKYVAQRTLLLRTNRFAVAIQHALVIHHGNNLEFYAAVLLARRLAARLEIHYTPKHGSWLNMAEVELSVLKGQCLDRRIPDLAIMQADSRMDNRPKQPHKDNQLAIHYGGRSDQAETSLFATINVT